MTNRIYTAPAGTGRAILGKTLPDIMYDACDRFVNPKALNQPNGDDWTPYSLTEFRQVSEDLARGLTTLNLEPGARVAFFMESDVHFCFADMGCLLAGLVSVPIYLTSAPDAITYIFNHAEAEALFVTNRDLLVQVAPRLADAPGIRTVVVAEGAADGVAVPDHVTVHTVEAVREAGRNASVSAETLRAQLAPDTLATIIYTSGTTGTPKGVLLTHENIAYNGLTSFSGLTGYREGPDGEVGISFLPMTHIFARTLHYGYLAYGNSVYFTTPNDLVRDLSRVRPTMFASVPRVLEKVYARIMEKAATLSGIQQKLLYWALDLAKAYELGAPPQGLAKIKYAIADKLIFSKWRDVLGGRVKIILSGGAALNADLANLFTAAGINTLQGYGLTETSPVITFNRPDRNRAGTVGEPIPGVEVTIAEDGEILTRGPHVMQGYYKEPEKTAAVMSEGGWFHTGDIGKFTPEGFLRITDRKKDLFKLSTGKYVMPQPLENELSTEPLVAQAVVVGNSQKFCSALIFPEIATLRTFCKAEDIPTPASDADLLAQTEVRALYQELVDKANTGMDHWSTIKAFVLLNEEVSIDNGLLTPSMKIKRPQINSRFADEITAIYTS